MATQATYFDGESATSHTVSLEPTATAVRISGNSIKNTVWAYADLKAVQKVQPGQELRLTCTTMPAARLTVPSGSASLKICRQAPHLTGAPNVKRIAKITGWALVSIMLVFGLLYLLLTVAPNTVAKMLPNEWRDRFGKQTEQSVVKSAKRCMNPSGQRALLKLAGKVASGSNSPPDFSIRVYDIKLMNAFAVAGGRIILTRGLLKAAESPGEVAGVVAHELGHIKHRHPEAALVRILGLQVLISAVTGSGDGETLGSIAGFAALLSYTRSAERQADVFAEKILNKSKIDTAGLIEFFKRVKKLEGKLVKNEKAKELLSIFSTHPGTQERIDKLKPLPKGTAIEVLTPLEWKALKNICSDTESGQAT